MASSRYASDHRSGGLVPPTHERIGSRGNFQGQGPGPQAQIFFHRPGPRLHQTLFHVLLPTLAPKFVWVWLCRSLMTMLLLKRDLADNRKNKVKEGLGKRRKSIMLVQWDFHARKSKNAWPWPPISTQRYRLDLPPESSAFGSHLTLSLALTKNNPTHNSVSPLRNTTQQRTAIWTQLHWLAMRSFWPAALTGGARLPLSRSKEILSRQSHSPGRPTAGLRHFRLLGCDRSGAHPTRRRADVLQKRDEPLLARAAWVWLSPGCKCCGIGRRMEPGLAAKPIPLLTGDSTPRLPTVAPSTTSPDRCVGCHC